jgi:hypothetical protein
VSPEEIQETMAMLTEDQIKTEATRCFLCRLDVDACKELIEAAHLFCLRVEAGEIYSQKTYNMFKSALSRMDK